MRELHATPEQAQTILSYGLRTVADLKLLTVDDLTECGIPRLHTRRGLPKLHEVGEAVATFVFFFILLVAAYVADKDCFRGGKKVAPMAQASSSSLTASDEDRKGKSKGLEAAVAMVTPSAQPGFDHKLTAEQQAQLPKDPGPAT